MTTRSGGAAGQAPVLSDARAARLRRAMWLGIAMGVVLASGATLLLLGTLGSGDPALEQRRAVTAVFFLVPAVLLLASSAVSLRLLPRRDRAARAAVVVTGGLAAVAGLLFSRLLLVGLPLTILGVATIFLAIFRERPAEPPR